MQILGNVFTQVNSLSDLQTLSGSGSSTKNAESLSVCWTNIKKLSKFIRSGYISSSIELVDFHVKWSEDMPPLFPAVSEAPIANGSDASSDIWNNSGGFKKR